MTVHPQHALNLLSVHSLEKLTIWQDSPFTDFYNPGISIIAGGCTRCSWKQKGQQKLQRDAEDTRERTLPFNEIGHAREGLVGDVDENSEAEGLVEGCI